MVSKRKSSVSRPGKTVKSVEPKRDRIAEEMGRRIREARTELNLTVPQIADALGKLYSHSRLGNYDQGLRRIGTEEARALAAVLRVDAAYLLCVEDQSMTDQERELLRAYRALPENERNKLLREVQAKALLYREPAHLTTQQLLAPRKPA